MLAMNKVWLFFVVLLVLSSPVYAFSLKIITLKDDFTYPRDTNFTATTEFYKSFSDSIEDLRYTLTIAGPATFEDGKRELTGEIGKLDKTQRRDVIIKLQDTTSDERQPITMSLKANYVLNAIVGGGKKEISEEKIVYLISTEKTRVVVEKEVAEREKAECEQNYNTCLNEKQTIQNERNTLSLEVAKLQQELQQAFYPVRKWEFLGFKGYWVLFLFGVLLIVAYKFGQATKKCNRRHFPSS